MASQLEILRLYRQMLKVGKTFTNYNYRTYAVRRIKDGFREHKSLSDQERVAFLVNKAQDSLEVMKRQVLLGRMYRHEKLVIEKVQ